MLIVTSITSTLYNLQDDKTMKFYKYHLINFMEKLYGSLRTMSEELQNADRVFIDSIGRLLSDINELIVQLLDSQEFEEQRDDLEKRLAWNIHLPYWFLHNAKQVRLSHAFDTLYEVPAKTGISLFQKSFVDNLIEDCIDCLYSMVKHVLEYSTDGNHYAEPRLMERIVYLGILALKHNKQGLFVNVGIKIYEFEDLYFKKYIAALKLPEGVDPLSVSGLPKKERLLNEVFQWRDQFNRNKYDSHRLSDRAEEKMYPLIDESDIDRFIFEVWGIILDDSSLNKEIEQRDRKQLLRRLLIALQRFQPKKWEVNS